MRHVTMIASVTAVVVANTWLPLQGVAQAVPLNLPALSADAACPVSAGSRDVVPSAPHIFGSGTVWFGTGPVYVNLAWKGDMLPPATFSIRRIPIEDGAYRAKTPWTAEPAYSGHAIVQGRSLRPDAKPLLFSVGSTRSERLDLQFPHDRPSAAAWSFWASSMYVPAAGCYGLQIDTTGRTTLVIFEAAP